MRRPTVESLKQYAEDNEGVQAVQDTDDINGILQVRVFVEGEDWQLRFDFASSGEWQDWSGGPLEKGSCLFHLKGIFEYFARWEGENYGKAKD